MLDHRDEARKNLMILALRITDTSYLIYEILACLITDTSYLMYEASLHHPHSFLLSNTTTLIQCPCQHHSPHTPIPSRQAANMNVQAMETEQNKLVRDQKASSYNYSMPSTPRQQPQTFMFVGCLEGICGSGGWCRLGHLMRD